MISGGKIIAAFEKPEDIWDNLKIDGLTFIVKEKQRGAVTKDDTAPVVLLYK